MQLLLLVLVFLMSTASWLTWTPKPRPPKEPAPVRPRPSSSPSPTTWYLHDRCRICNRPLTVYASRIEGIGPDCQRRLGGSYRQRVPNPDYVRFQTDLRAWDQEREDQLRRWKADNIAVFVEFESQLQLWEQERRTPLGRRNLAIHWVSLALATGAMLLLVSARS